MPRHLTKNTSFYLVGSHLNRNIKLSNDVSQLRSVLLGVVEDIAILVVQLQLDALVVELHIFCVLKKLVNKI